LFEFKLHDRLTPSTETAPSTIDQTEDRRQQAGAMQHIPEPTHRKLNIIESNRIEQQPNQQQHFHHVHY
jgi:hypothetical protein